MAKQNHHIKAFLTKITPEYAQAALAEYCAVRKTAPANCKWLAYAVIKELDPNNGRYEPGAGYDRDALDRSMAAKLRRELVKLDSDDASPVELRGWGKRQILRVVSDEERAQRAADDAECKKRVDFVERAADNLNLDLDGYRGRASGGDVTLTFAQFKELVTTAMVHKRLH